MLTLLMATTTTQSAGYHPFALRALLPSQTAGDVGSADAVANIAANTSTTVVPMTPASFDHSWPTLGQLPAAVTSSGGEKLPAFSSGQLPAVVITAASAAPVDRSRPYAGQQLPAVVTSPVIDKVDAASPVDRSRPYSGQLPAVVLTADDGKEEVTALPELPGGQVCVY